MSWFDLDLTLDLAVATLTYKILSGLFNAWWEINTAAVVLFIYNLLIIGPRGLKCQSWAGNLLMCSDLTLGPPAWSNEDSQT